MHHPRATRRFVALAAMAAGLVAAPAHAGAPAEFAQVGRASWYGPGFAGRQTASGETFDPSALTAAHTTLPFGSIVEITNLENGRSIVARINDRGPFSKGRILDCSHAIANTLGFLRQGLARVRIRVVELVNAPEPLPSKKNTPTSRGKKRPALDVAMLAAAVDCKSPSDVVPLRCDSYCVQIGAYREPDNAADMLQRASILDVPAFMHSSRKLLHVLVGPYADRSRAAQVQTQLTKAGFRGFVRLFED